MAKKKVNRKGDSLIRDALILFAITLLLGLVLGWVYMLTKNPIDKAAEAAKQEAYARVFADYNNITVEADDELNKLIDKYKKEGAEIKGQDGEVIDAEISEGVAVKDASGTVLGFAFIAKSKGYGGDVSVSVGVTPDGTITGIDIVSMSETAGLGANCTQDWFKNQYAGKSGQIVVSKVGASADNEIDALSGATITSNAVTRSVNACLALASELGN